MNAFSSTFWISVGVLILGMYAVIRMLGYLVDLGFAAILQLFTGIEQGLNWVDLDNQSIRERSSTT
jgi:hypothetical protein